MSDTFEKSICVIGLGYIGLPTAAVLASRGYRVHGVEVNADAIEIINSGKAHIVEPELDILVRAAVQTGNLRAHAEPETADVFMICVPTPLNDDLQPEMGHVWGATESMAPFLEPGNLVILESTSPPGTTARIAEMVEELTGLTSKQVHFAHAPERVLPGRILREVVENDRIVGGLDPASTEEAVEFYRTFVSGQILVTNAQTAETTKLVENAFRDVNIAFANEISLISDELGLDVWEVIALANHHPRVEILSPGPGVGGHCIAVDPWYLVHSAPGSTRLIRTAREVNKAKPTWVVDRVKSHAIRFKSPRIACLGLTYKADVDDLRESPALEIVRTLAKEAEAELRVVEPNLGEHPEFDLMPLESALMEADIVVILVPHRQFRSIPQALLTEKIVVDTCGIVRRPASD